MSVTLTSNSWQWYKSHFSRSNERSANCLWFFTAVVYCISTIVVTIMIHPHLLELELLTLWSMLWSFHTSLPWPSLLPFVFVVFEASLPIITSSLPPHGRSSCYAIH